MPSGFRCICCIVPIGTCTMPVKSVGISCSHMVLPVAHSSVDTVWWKVSWSMRSAQSFASSSILVSVGLSVLTLHSPPCPTDASAKVSIAVFMTWSRLR